MNNLDQNKQNVSQATAATPSRRAALGYALRLVGCLVVGASYSSGSALRHEDYDGDNEQNEPESLWDTEWGKTLF